MKAVIQRCLSASVTVDGQTISSINKGFLVLVGIGTEDTSQDITTLTKKILSLKLFDESSTPLSSDPSEKPVPGKSWKRSVMDIGGEVLCVSQFTLLAKTEKGSKPDFHGAMTAAQSRIMYSDFLRIMGETYDPDKIKDGAFGEMMQVTLVNDGPVTIVLDTKSKTNGSLPGSGTSTPKLKNKKGENKARNAEEIATDRSMTT